MVEAQKPYDNQVALIVGASSGIGKTLAVRLATLGAHVVVVARRRERLVELKREIDALGGQCSIHASDALDPAAAEQVVRECVERSGKLDLLVLNAGGAPALDLRVMTAQEVTGYMRSNYDVAVNYLMPALQQMVQQGHGTVAHTNSLAGFMGVPLQGPYSAAKGALRLLIDACRVEYAAHGIDFVSLYPGFVSTEATQGDGMPAPASISEEQAVDYILRALRKRRGDYLFPASMAWMVRLGLLLPKPLLNRILRAELEKARPGQQRALPS